MMVVVVALLLFAVVLDRVFVERSMSRRFFLGSLKEKK